VVAYLDCLALFLMVLVTTLEIVHLVVDWVFELRSWSKMLEHVQSHELMECESITKGWHIRKGQQL
jgi:hypothetical protein